MSNPYKETTIHQVSYDGDGNYIFKCSECKHKFPAMQLRLTDFSTESFCKIPNNFPLKYCCNCGIKFNMCKTSRED